MAHVRRAIVALLLGAIASVLIAWGIDIAHQQHKAPRILSQFRVDPKLSPPPKWTWFVTPDLRIGHRQYTFRLGIDRADQREYNETIDAIMMDDFPAWIMIPTSGMYLESHAFGFPFPCIARQNVNTNQPRDLVEFSAFSRRRIIATRPVWSGLVINSVILGGLLYPLTLFPARRRRRKRRQQGLCGSCAYDLRGTTHRRCPECGILLKRSR